MRIIRATNEIPPPTGSRGFVPTMGALHEGHLELVRKAKQICGEAVVSIYVNPLQFGPSEDFAKYPRQEERDAQLLESAGADILWLPAKDAFAGSQELGIDVGALARRCEGAFRPGHFNGVATIVAKLFNVVQPNWAFFGLKDRQQCAVIAKLIRELNYQIQLGFVETVREADGLAMSSRNAYLNPEERATSCKIYRSLVSAKDRIQGGIPASAALETASEELRQAGFDVQYLSLVDGHTFEERQSPNSESVIVVAAKIGATRLIDNIDFRVN